MAVAIISKQVTLHKYFKTNDAIPAKQRLKIPFTYKWLKFKTGFFGLTLIRGIRNDNRPK